MKSETPVIVAIVVVLVVVVLVVGWAFSALPAGAEPAAARATLTPIPTGQPLPAYTPNPYPEPSARSSFAIGETLVTAWLDPLYARVTWAGAPAGSCLHRVRSGWPDVLIPNSCTVDGWIDLGPGGDIQYTPRPGDTYVLRDERNQAELGRVTLGDRPRYISILPVVVN